MSNANWGAWGGDDNVRAALRTDAGPMLRRVSDYSDEVLLARWRALRGEAPLVLPPKRPALSGVDRGAVYLATRQSRGTPGAQR